MFHLGYRPAAAESHRVTFEFMKLSVDDSLMSTITYFDRVRVKRHRTLYDEVGLVTDKETKEFLSKAKEFLDYVSRQIAPQFLL